MRGAIRTLVPTIDLDDPDVAMPERPLIGTDIGCVMDVAFIVDQYGLVLSEDLTIKNLTRQWVDDLSFSAHYVVAPCDSDHAKFVTVAMRPFGYRDAFEFRVCYHPDLIDVEVVALVSVDRQDFEHRGHQGRR